MSFKEEFYKLIGPELSNKAKALYQKFNAPVPAPAAPAPAPAPVPVALQEALLEDGTTTLKYNTPSLSVGSVVTIVSPEGEMPAPEGELKLQDGTVIVVKNDGQGNSVVESLTPVAAPAPVVQSAAPVVPTAILAQMEAMEQNFKKVSQEKEDLKTEFEAFKKSINSDFAELLEVFKPFLDAPSANPIETPNNKFESAINKKAKILSQFSK